MMIFDQFASREQADAFAARVVTQFGRDAVVFPDVESANQHDPFPFELHPPIVHVDRDYETYAHESEIRELVAGFGGVFAGT